MQTAMVEGIIIKTPKTHTFHGCHDFVRVLIQSYSLEFLTFNPRALLNPSPPLLPVVDLS